MKRNIKLWEQFIGDGNRNSITMPAGNYWIGDLCYVMGDKWDRFCDITISGHDVKYGIHDIDGTQVVFFGTKYGDGVYNDRSGKQYPVDAGLIGAIKVDDITDPDASISNGHIHKFETPWVVDEHDGVIEFGDVIINTADEEEDDYEEDDYYDEDEYE